MSLYARKALTITNTKHTLFDPKPLFFSTTPTLSNLLSALTTKAQSLLLTKQTHAVTLINGYLPQSISISASLILQYATFHDPACSLLLFNESVNFSRSAFLWNTLVRALSIAGVNDQFETYNRMIRVGVRPDDRTFPYVLKACADELCYEKGLEVHASAFKHGLGLDVFVGNTLMAFYGSCGNLSDVKKVFDEMRERDVVSWNTVIGVFSDNGLCRDAVGLFLDMNLDSGVRPNAVSVVTVLPVCASLEEKGLAKQVHCYVVKVGLDLQVTVGNALVDVYGKCGSVEGALQAFDGMVERNEVSWNAFLTSLAYSGCFKDGLEVFRLMIGEGMKPNSFTISRLLPVLVELEVFDLAKEIHAFSLRSGVELDVFIRNSLINMYAKAGESDKAFAIFGKMQEKNIVSWNAMIANCAQNRLELVALELVRDMQSDGEIPNSITFVNVLPACARVGFARPGKEIHARAIRTGYHSDLFVTNALTDMYAKCGCLNLAQKVFDISVRDEVSYNILIVGYCQTANCSESLSLFSEMDLCGMKHDIISYMGAISACANLAAQKQGKEIHGAVIKENMHAHLFIANALLDLYTKCGRIEIARMVFDRIADKDAASWNTMILGYGMLGELHVAIDLFEAMKEDGVDYDSVSYIAVLSACSHGGLVQKGKKYFEEMQVLGIETTQMHYACMVDLLGRAGYMEDAVKLIQSMPMEADSNVWGALLGACRIHGNIELASWATEHLFKLKPQHSGYYAILSNMYAEVGKWEQANQVREHMRLQGTKKNPGCSWVQTNDRVHAFISGERVPEKFDSGHFLAEL